MCINKLLKMFNTQGNNLYYSDPNLYNIWNIPLFRFCYILIFGICVTLGLILYRPLMCSKTCHSVVLVVQCLSESLSRSCSRHVDVSLHDVWTFMVEFNTGCIEFLEKHKHIWFCAACKKSVKRFSDLSWIMWK